MARIPRWTQFLDSVQHPMHAEQPRVPEIRPARSRSHRLPQTTVRYGNQRIRPRSATFPESRCQFAYARLSSHPDEFPFLLPRLHSPERSWPADQCGHQSADVRLRTCGSREWRTPCDLAARSWSPTVDRRQPWRVTMCRHRPEDSARRLMCSETSPQSARLAPSLLISEAKGPQ